MKNPKNEYVNQCTKLCIKTGMGFKQCLDACEISVKKVHLESTRVSGFGISTETTDTKKGWALVAGGIGVMALIALL
ncbi:MAG: hypothetical protein KAT70_00410 [Thermoplasmata archaeon]|nr:hypothetical protein [Thermoplasmata archaeon]